MIQDHKAAKNSARRLAHVAIQQGYKPEALHEYTDAQGNILYCRIRLRHPSTGEKWMRPMRFDPNQGYQLGEPNFPTGKPLYRLLEITQNPNETVWIVEGEWCVDHLVKLGLIATTSGCARSAGSADWKILEGKKIVIWPDNDAPGLRYAEEVTTKLLELNCSVQWVDIARLNLPLKGDCIDFLKVFYHQNERKASATDILALPVIPDLPNKSGAEDNLNYSAAQNSKQSPQSDEEIITHLASLNPLEYDRVRAEKAKNLNVRAAILDKMVKAARLNESKNNGLPFTVVEPHPESVNPAELLNEISNLVRRFIVLEIEQAHAVALWIALTWFIDVIEVAPLAIINAPEKSCGKTQLLTVLSHMCYRPLPASNASASALFRAVEAWMPTLLIDEADTFFRDNTELHGMVNAGYARGGFVLRSEAVGDSFEPRSFAVFSTKALAGINLEKHLPDATMSRGVIFNLRRKLSHESVSRLRHTDKHLFAEVTEKLARFAIDYLQQVAQARPILPEALNDREQDNWEGLFAIALCAGEKWLAYADAAALKLSSSSEQAISTSNELLADIQQIFEKKRIDKIKTAELITELCSDEEAPWSTYNRGKPITPRQVSRQLQTYGITSKTIRLNACETPKGFELSQFEDAFMRYLSTPGNLPPQRNKSSTASLAAVLTVADNPKHKIIRNSSATAEAPPTLECGGVADKTPILEGVEAHVKTKVACKTCFHFQPNEMGHGGIGLCQANGWRTGQPPLYPNALRTCTEFNNPKTA